MEATERTRQAGSYTLPPAVRDERIHLIQTYWTALMSGDMKTFETLLAPDAVIHYPGNHWLSGDYTTTEEIVGLYRILSQFVLDGIFVGELLDIVVGDVYAGALLKYELKLPFKTIPGRATGLFIIEHGKIKEYWLHEWDQVMINRVFKLSRIFRPFMTAFQASSSTRSSQPAT